MVVVQLWCPTGLKHWSTIPNVMELKMIKGTSCIASSRYVGLFALHCWWMNTFDCGLNGDNRIYLVMWYIDFVDVMLCVWHTLFGWIAIVNDKCYVFTYIYATLIWLEFSPFCCYDAWMASCRLAALELFGRGSSSVVLSVALIRNTG